MVMTFKVYRKIGRSDPRPCGWYLERNGESHGPYATKRDAMLTLEAVLHPDTKEPIQ